MKAAKLKLAVFDFDNTIINVNSDTYIDKLVAAKRPRNTEASSGFKYPSEIEAACQEYNWTHRMNKVFEYMRQTHSITKQEILDCLREIKLDAAMCELIRTLRHDHDYELVILSDANTVFIEEILLNHGLHDKFAKIYTNPGRFDEHEQLIVTPFNEIFNPSNGPFNCETQMCASNICKGQVLRKHVSERLGDAVQDGATFENAMSMIYVGDGRNDYCPGLCLSKSDLYFVRENFALAKLLRRQEELAEKLSARVYFWSHAQEILENFK